MPRIRPLANDAAAAKCLQELIAVAPDYVAAHQQLGQSLVRQGRTDEARQAWHQGVEAAQKAGTELSGRFPMLQVLIYDAATKRRSPLQ